MATTAKLSNILLATVLGASASAASATDDGHKFNAQANADAYNKIFNQTSVGAQGGNVSASATSDNSITISNVPHSPPKILKESYDLGPCSGNAYQALWLSVKLTSLSKEHSLGNLTGATENSFTLRQYGTEIDTDRKWSAEAIARQLEPKRPVPTSPIGSAYNAANQTNTNAGVDQSANSSQRTSVNAVSYIAPQNYTDVTYHCTLGK